MQFNILFLKLKSDGNPEVTLHYGELPPSRGYLKYCCFHKT